MNKKVWALIKYRVFNLPVENIHVIIFITGFSLVGALLGLPVIATMLCLYAIPTMVSYNGIEPVDLKITKTQLAMPISRQENIATRFAITALFQIFGIILAYIFHVSSSFFINLGWGEALWGFDLGGLNWLIADTSFMPIFLFAVGFSLLDRGIYFASSYTIFKKAGKPPFWFGIVIFMFAGAFAGTTFSWPIAEVLGEHMQLAMFVLGILIFVVSYFISVMAFRKIDFS